MAIEQSDSKSPHVRKLAEQARDYQPEKPRFLCKQTEEEEFHPLEKLVDTLFNLVRVGGSIILEIKSTFHDDFENGMSYFSEIIASDFIDKRYEKKGERLLKRFITNNPDDERVAEAHYHLGNLYWGKDSKRAFEQFKEAVDHNHNHLRAHHALVLCGKEIHAELVDYLQKALADNPDYELGHISLGMVYEEKGELEKAVEEYRKAFPHPLAHYRLGNLYFDKTLDEEAAFNEFIQATIKPSELASSIEEEYNLSDFVRHRDLGIMTIMQRHSADMSFVGICERAINSHPTNIGPYNLLANAYREKGMLEEAIKTYQRVLEFESNSATFHREIGDIYATMKRPDQAIQAYEKALEIKGDDGFALLGMGQVYYDKGEYKKALDTWKKIPGSQVLDIGYPLITTGADLVKKAKEKLKNGIKR